VSAAPDPAASADTAPVARTVVRRSLAWRVAAACLAVALVAVAVAAIVALRLVSTTARQVTQDVLAQEADIIAAQLADPALIGNPGPVRQAAASRKLVQTLQAQGADIVLLGRVRTGTGPVATALTEANADQALAGTSVSASVDVAGRTYVVEARPAANSAFALVRRSDMGPVGTGLIRRNLGFALLAGAGVALLVGLVVGTLMARPLRRTAAAAHLLRTGRRDVRVPVRGPAEVAEVAAAVNELADALVRSESRQREFLLSVSHELRTPLTAVRGFAESLADGVVTGRDVIPTGATIVAEATRLDRLVGDLMELARLEADDFRLDLMPVDLGALAREAATVWDARCRAADVVFTLYAPKQSVPVTADPRRLRQVVDGLAENALRITPAGAPLAFAVFPGGVMQVRDGGPGLAPDDYAIVFDRGALHERYRGHRPVGAGGVGLALVQGLVTRMGGTIKAERAPEGGACFTVALPGPAPSVA
jgi:two-component system OmpR family sensor kinase